MNADTLGAVFNALIMACGGAWAWMLGTRKLGKPPGLSPEHDAWHERFGGRFRVIGPLVMVGAVVVLAFQLLAPR